MKSIISILIASCVFMGCQPSSFPSIDTKPLPVQTIRIEVSGTGNVTVGGEGRIVSQAVGDSDVCQCGCGKTGCVCATLNKSGQFSQGVKAAPVKPVVTMFTDFNDGECGACDLAWWDYTNNGGNWPFTLVKKRGNIRGGTSPTFLLPNGKTWRPTTYSVGELLKKVD